MIQHLQIKVSVLGLLALLFSNNSITTPARANEIAAAIEIKEEQYIVNPVGDSVVMIFDLFSNQQKLKVLPSAERAIAAKLLVSRVTDHYLATLSKSDAASIKTANVALVYIPKRNEYQNPDLSSLQQLGVAKVVIRDGKSAVEGDVVGELKF